jgi:hypothetical protein
MIRQASWVINSRFQSSVDNGGLAVRLQGVLPLPKKTRWAARRGRMRWRQARTTSASMSRIPSTTEGGAEPLN